MIRHCDGNDVHLRTTTGTYEEAQPCRCGLVFDDIEQSVIYPHESVRSGMEMCVKCHVSFRIDCLDEEGNHYYEYLGIQHGIVCEHSYAA